MNTFTQLGWQLTGIPPEIVIKKFREYFSKFKNLSDLYDVKNICEFQKQTFFINNRIPEFLVELHEAQEEKKYPFLDGSSSFKSCTVDGLKITIKKYPVGNIVKEDFIYILYNTSINVRLINIYDITTLKGMSNFLDIIKNRISSLLENKYTDFHIHNSFCKYKDRIEVIMDMDTIDRKINIKLKITDIEMDSLVITIDGCKGIDIMKLIKKLHFPY